jgi:hypothetical protein
VPSDRVGGGEILVAGDGNERMLQLEGHRLHPAGFAATSRALEHDGKAALECGAKHVLIVGEQDVKRGRGWSSM